MSEEPYSIYELNLGTDWRHTLGLRLPLVPASRHYYSRLLPPLFPASTTIIPGLCHHCSRPPATIIPGLQPPLFTTSTTIIPSLYHHYSQPLPPLFPGSCHHYSQPLPPLFPASATIVPGLLPLLFPASTTIITSFCRCSFRVPAAAIPDLLLHYS